MSSGRRSPDSHHLPHKLDQTIMAYTLMSREQIEAELKAQGLDPQPTIDAIRAFVEAKLHNSSRAIARRK